jgi:hypothetical protein
MLVLAAVVLAGSTGLLAQQGVGLDGPTGPRTSIVIGQVLDGTTGRPVPEAIVRLSMPQFAPDSPSTPNGRVIADTDGRFFFADLPAGEYWIEARVDGYLTGAFGQRRPGGDGERLHLREGERRTDVTMRVWQYGVIAGRVLDEAGEPVVGVSVRALLKDVVAGRVQYGSEPYLVPTTLTDDRGMFRLARVPAGTYVVVVPSMHTTLPASVMSGDANALRTDLFWAGVQETTPFGNPRTQQVGDEVLMSLSAVAVPPAPSTDGRLSMYRTTFYPSATTASASTAISVAAGEERTDVVFTLRPTPSARVSGRLVTPDGTPPLRTAIKLTGDARANVTTRSLPSGAAEVGLDAALSVSDAGGGFSFLGVPPGEYVLTHGDNFLSRTAREGRPVYWFNQRLTVGGDDLQNLVVALRPALRVEGRIVARRAMSEPPRSEVPRGVVVFESATGAPDQFAVETQTEQFATVASAGRYIVRPTAFGGWFIESITLDGKDITERPFDLDGDATSFVITYTNQPSKVSGSVKDARGSAATDAMVLVFPADSQRWIDYGKSPRMLRAVDVTPAGTYTFDHLVAGEYFIVAIGTSQAEGWRDPEMLKTLSSRAERLSVGAGSPARTLDLTLRTLR